MIQQYKKALEAYNRVIQIKEDFNFHNYKEAKRIIFHRKH